MIDKAKMFEMLQTLFADDATTLEEDLNLWGVEPEAYEAMMRYFTRLAANDIAKGIQAQDGNEIKGALASLFTMGFGLGYRSAMEAEMQRISSET